MRTDRDYLIAPERRRGLSKTEAAQYIGISAPTFDRLVEAGAMPKPIRIFSRLVWDRWVVDEAFTRLGDKAIDTEADE